MAEGSFWAELTLLQLPAGQVDDPPSLQAHPSDNTYLKDFDRTEFFTNFATWGVPFLVTYAAALWVLARVNFKLKLLPAWVGHSNRLFGFANRSEDAFERWIPWISALAYTMLLLPLVFLCRLSTLHPYSLGRRPHSYRCCQSPLASLFSPPPLPLRVM